MPTYTNYKNLEKPLSTDLYDIAVMNKNYDIIDSELHRLDLKNENQDNLLSAKSEPAPTLSLTNNLLATEPGTALDAVQGKELKDAITAQNDDFTQRLDGCTFEIKEDGAYVKYTPFGGADAVLKKLGEGGGGSYNVKITFTTQQRLLTNGVAYHSSTATLRMELTIENGAVISSQIVKVSNPKSEKVDGYNSTYYQVELGAVKITNIEISSIPLSQ